MSDGFQWNLMLPAFGRWQQGHFGLELLVQQQFSVQNVLKFMRTCACTRAFNKK